jgi:hypothetical protein
MKGKKTALESECDRHELDLRVSTAALDVAHTDPEDFVIEISGSLGCFRDESAVSLEIGKLSACIVQVERALVEGQSVFDVMDAHETASNYMELYDFDTAEFGDSVQSLFGDGILTANLLILDKLAIEPKHRGRGLGLLALSRVIDVFGPSCDLVVCQPYPMQFGGAAEDPEWMTRFGAGLDDDEKRGIARLAKHWQKLGFRQIPSTKFYAISPNDRRLTGG